MRKMMRILMMMLMMVLLMLLLRRRLLARHRPPPQQQHRRFWGSGVVEPELEADVRDTEIKVRMYDVRTYVFICSSRGLVSSQFCARTIIVLYLG